MIFLFDTSMLSVIFFTNLPTPVKIEVVHPIALGEFKIARFNGSSVFIAQVTLQM